MVEPIFLIGDKQYKSIYSFCLALSQKKGWREWYGDVTEELNMLVPYQFTRPDLFDLVSLDLWFEEHVEGPDLVKAEAVNYRNGQLNGWWIPDKEVQKLWRDKAIKELTEIVGYMFPQ